MSAQAVYAYALNASNILNHYIMGPGFAPPPPYYAPPPLPPLSGFPTSCGISATGGYAQRILEDAPWGALFGSASRPSPFSIVG